MLEIERALEEARTLGKKRRRQLIIWGVVFLVAIIAVVLILAPKLAILTSMQQVEDGARGSLNGYFAEAQTPSDNLTIGARNLLRRLGANDPKGKKLVVDHPASKGVNPLGISYLIVMDKKGKVITSIEIPDDDEVIATVKLCRWAKKFGKKV